MDVVQLEDEAGHGAVLAPRGGDQRLVHVEAHHAAARGDGLGDAARDRPGATADVQHGQAGGEPLQQPALIARERAAIQHAVRARWHDGPIARDVLVRHRAQGTMRPARRA
jgi:hypothetical protein